MPNLLQTAPLKQRGQLPTERRVITPRSPPITVAPCGVEILITRMRGIDRPRCAPVGVLIDQPATWAKTLRHSRYSRLLAADEMKQHKTRAHNVKRTGT